LSQSIGPKIVLEGQKEYKQSIADINRETRVLGSEMRLLAKEFDGSANSQEALEKKSEALNKQYLEQEKKVRTLKGALEDAKKVYGENSSQVKNWQIQLNNAEGKLIDLDNELKTNDKYLGEAEKSTLGVAKSIDEFGKEIGETEEKVSAFGDVLKANLASEMIISGVKKLGEGINKIAKFSIGVGSDFTRSMSSVGATMGLTTEEINNGSVAFESLKKAAKDAGATTEFTAKDSAQALEYLALAGYDAVKAVETLPSVLNLASAGGLDLKDSANLVTNSMSALRIESDRLDEHMDKMAKTAQSSNTDVAQLGEAILASAGMATSTQQSLDTLNTSIGILGNNGLKGAEAGTKLRNMLQSLASPTDKAREELEKLGISATDNQGNFKQLDEIMQELNAELKTMSAKERTEIISKIFNKTDITAVNSLLNSMGGEFQELKEKIENADGSAEEMAKTMRDNLKGDMNALQSVTEATGITFFEKFEKPLRRATQSATEGLGDLNKELSGGRLGKSVDDLAENFGELADKAISFGIDALPKIIDGAGWIIDNADNIISLVGGIVTGMVAFKIGGAIQKGITAVNGAWKLYKASTESATISQTALNVVMNANPVGLIATGIGLATAALIKYDLASGGLTKSQREASKAMREVEKRTKEMNKTLGETLGKWEEQEKKFESNSVIAKKLSGDLYDLQKKENLSNIEKEKMKGLVDNLNKMIPDLSLSINEQTGELSKQKAEVDGLIDSYLEMARAEAAAESLKDMLKEQYEAELVLKEATEQLSDSLGIGSALSGEFSGVLGGWNLFKKAKEIKELDEQTKLLGNRIEATAEVVVTSSEETNKAVEEHGEIVEETSELIIEANELATKAMEDAQEEYRKQLEQTEDAIYKSTGLFDEFAKNTEKSGEVLLDNLLGQVKGMENWAKNLEELSKKGIEEGLLKELYDMGPKASGEIEALNKMTKKELDKYNTAWKEKTKLASDIAIKQLESQREDMGDVAGKIAYDMGDYASKAGLNYAEKLKSKNKDVQNALKFIKNASDRSAKALLEKSGENTASGFASGFKNKEKTLLATIEATLKRVKSKTNQVLQINSPSKVFEEIGGFTAEGFGIGFDKEMKKINDELDIPIINNKSFDTTEKGSADNNNVILGALSNLKLVAKTETPLIIGNEEAGRILMNIQLANDERYNPTAQYSY